MQIKLMRSGGNDACNVFLESYGVKRNTPIAQKYNSPAALLYKERLIAAVEGRPLPTDLPKTAAGNTAHTTVQGTDPLPGESEADYVARQRRLQEEARERLRQKFGASSGLSSKGSMQGIGSDASYRPGDATENVTDKAISALQSVTNFFLTVSASVFDAYFVVMVCYWRNCIERNC
jgi:ADP-ribosylation factor GTPase-activating protein 1